jgi:prepilin-type N-terminal cleavage/methylation domain-containing protein
MNNYKKQGFTLVEIMIVVMIIGLLAAIAVPGFQKARNSAYEKSCINNLRLIEGAKDQYAIDEGLVTDDAIPDGALDVYFKNETMIECPIEGTYDIGAVDTAPTCDAHDDTTHNVNGQI